MAIVLSLTAWCKFGHGCRKCRVAIERVLHGLAPPLWFRSSKLDALPVLGIVHGFQQIIANVVCRNDLVWIREFPVAHRFGFAFLRVFKDIERVVQQGAVKKPNPAMMFESGHHGHIAPGMAIDGFSPFGGRLHSSGFKQ